ncbi:hypothetical protein GGS20DRAFT_597051 [Poronia punctata]|nr:hypothetical protein GGS20DRAFT_597051 [Poronia punctata]
MKLSPSIFALSILGKALADCGKEGETITIDNDGGFDKLKELEQCDIIKGDIIIDPKFVYFILDGPTEIQGKITAHNNEILKFVAAANVTKIGGYSLADPAISSQTSFPELVEIGNLEWTGIQQIELYGLFAWKAPHVSHISNFSVTATELSGFTADYPTLDEGEFYYDGFPALESADKIEIKSNWLMPAVVFEALKTIGRLTISNNKRLEKIEFPLLTKAGEIFIADNVTEINFPVLEQVESFTVRVPDSSLLDCAALDGIRKIAKVFECDKYTIPRNATKLHY